MTDLASSTAIEEEELRPISAIRLAEANINPLTGLATDYLNHFNEAIMLLEILPMDPEILPDFLQWRPLSYADHFHASHFKDREIAVAAYEAADPVARRRLDMLADIMTEVLTATREALEAVDPDTPTAQLATRAAAWLKPLVARAGAVINGAQVQDDGQGGDEDPQAVIDAIMGR